MRTPWGPSQSVTIVGDGIVLVSTAGHGGYKLDAIRNRKVHAAWRCAGGWYEEGCDWSRVALTFPELFTAKQLESAKRTAKNYAPDAYAAVTGEPVTLAESYKLRHRAFDDAHKTHLVGVSAWGDWADGVPKGMVRVLATLGGDSQMPGVYYLVDKADYAAREEFGFVVDPTKHQPEGQERTAAAS
ncbi:MAG: DUF7007 domain-containing protein [Polyangiales bacterium]